MFSMECIKQYAQKYYGRVGKLKHILSGCMSNNNHADEYLFILDGYYFCEKNKSTRVIIRMRNKRTSLNISVMDIVSNKSVIRALSPIDAYIIGVLANNARNGIRDIVANSLQKMRRIKNNNCYIKLGPILQVTKIIFGQYGQEKIVLRSTVLNKEVEISIKGLLKNRALLHALDPLQALSIGYNVSEACLREQYVEQTHV